jgi:hypothetical protein
LSPRSAEAIAAAREHDVKVVFATARPPRGCKRFYEALDLDTVTINHNGAVVYDPQTGKTMVHHRLDGGAASNVIELAQRLCPNLAVGVETLDTFHAQKNRDRLAEEPSLALSKSKQDSSFDQALEQGVTKIVLVGDADGLGEVAMRLQEKFGDSVRLAFTHMRLLSVIHAEACKAGALGTLAEHYGIERRKTMAVGDAPNDLDMIQWAGLGVATANAWSDVREAAHFVVGSNDDNGVAEAIEKFVLCR